MKTRNSITTGQSRRQQRETRTVPKVLFTETQKTLASPVRSNKWRKRSLPRFRLSASNSES